MYSYRNQMHLDYKQDETAMKNIICRYTSHNDCNKHIKFIVKRKINVFASI